MFILFILMILGWICWKLGYITDEVSKKLSSIVVNIANPAAILTGSMTESKLSQKELLVVVIIVLAIFVFLLALARILPCILKVSADQKGVYQAMTVFSNIGFMGIPVITALYGTGALIYVVIFTLPYNILLYTYGVSVMTRKETQKQNWKTAIKDILNVGVLVSVFSLIIYVTGFKPPMLIRSSLDYLSNLVAPLSMMIVGASFGKMNLKDMLSDHKLLIFAIIKMLVIPIAGMLIIKQFVTDPVLLCVCLIMLGTPVGSMTAMLAQQHHVDTETASKGIALTTILSVATIPFISAILL